MEEITKQSIDLVRQAQQSTLMNNKTADHDSISTMKSKPIVEKENSNRFSENFLFICKSVVSVLRDRGMI